MVAGVELEHVVLRERRKPLGDRGPGGTPVARAHDRAAERVLVAFAEALVLSVLGRGVHHGRIVLVDHDRERPLLRRHALRRVVPGAAAVIGAQDAVVGAGEEDVGIIGMHRQREHPVVAHAEVRAHPGASAVVGHEEASREVTEVDPVRLGGVEQEGAVLVQPAIPGRPRPRADRAAQLAPFRPARLEHEHAVPVRAGEEHAVGRRLERQDLRRRQAVVHLHPGPTPIG